VSEIERVQPGDVLVTDMTDHWEPVMKKASAIVTNRAVAPAMPRSSRANWVFRRWWVAAMRSERVADGGSSRWRAPKATPASSSMACWRPKISEVKRGEMPYCPVKITMNVGNPTLAFDFAQIPNSRRRPGTPRFIINNNIGVHRRRILDYRRRSDLKKAVESVARGQPRRVASTSTSSPKASRRSRAFFPKPVIVRLSDFRATKYRKLIGGTRYEPGRGEPDAGLRGASRYISGEFSDAFAMECEA